MGKKRRIVSLVLAFIMGFLSILPQSMVLRAAGTRKAYVKATAMYSYAYEVLDLINAERAKEGLSALSMDIDLVEAAMQRAAENVIAVALTENLDHNRPDGSAFWTVSDKAFGENIAAGQRTPESVVAAWMGSTGHKGNILDKTFTCVGIGCVKIGTGYYCYWAQEFGYNTAKTGTRPSDGIRSYTIECKEETFASLSGLGDTYKEYISTSEPFTGWKKTGGVWKYYENDDYVTGWLKNGGFWYYLDADGVMQTGWKRISGKWYFFSGSGAMKTGWVQSSGKWYYLAGSGAMVTGWRKIGTVWYYFTGSGAMKTGWFFQAGNWYYFTGSGVMVTGERSISGKTYRFNADGVCLNP